MTDFSFPLSLVDWFPEAEVLKKRKTLRQLVQTLQLRLSPDLQYDVQQGALPPAPVLPQTSVGDASIGTARDAEVLNAVAASAADADSADLLQASLGQCATNECKLSNEAEDCVSGPVLHYVPEHDAAGATLQLVTANTSVTGDGAVDASMPAAGEAISSSVGVCRAAPVSTCTAATGLTQTSCDDRVVFEHLIHEQNGNKLVADAGHLALPTDVTDANDKPCNANDIGNSLCQVADTASRLVDSVSHVTVPCVNESLVMSTELPKNAHNLSGDGSADS